MALALVFSQEQWRLLPSILAFVLVIAPVVILGSEVRRRSLLRITEEGVDPGDGRFRAWTSISKANLWVELLELEVDGVTREFDLTIFGSQPFLRSLTERKLQGRLQKKVRMSWVICVALSALIAVAGAVPVAVAIRNFGLLPQYVLAWFCMASLPMRYRYSGLLTQIISLVAATWIPLGSTMMKKLGL